jgi:hypothetical protein
MIYFMDDVFDTPTVGTRPSRLRVTVIVTSRDFGFSERKEGLRSFVFSMAWLVGTTGIEPVTPTMSR